MADFKATTKRVTSFIDGETGEIVNNNNASPACGIPIETQVADLPHTGGKNATYPFEWVAMFLPAFERIIMARLTMRECHVLMQMLREMRYQNYIDVPHRLIAEEIGIDRADVTKAINKLVAKDILIKVPDRSNAGRSNYRLNPIIGYKGTAAEWHKERKHGNVIRGHFRGKSK